jgi:hypothetical protein
MKNIIRFSGGNWEKNAIAWKKKCIPKTEDG